jgi:hypothetical protein
LWVRFFRHAQIYPVDALIGGFRLHEDSLFLQNIEECYRIYEDYIDAELESAPYGQWLRVFRRIGSRAETIPILRPIWKRQVMDRLYFRRGRDWPPVIEYRTNKWDFRREE